MSSGDVTERMVRVDTGVLQGIATGDPAISAFRGIPYAAAPTGALRWRPPAPAAAWEGVRQAAEPGASCLQPVTPPDAFYTIDQPRMSEDCLFLDVWAPDGARGLPVMVWIHGGAFVWGAGSEPWYDGTRLAAKNIVVVTFNYRLGVFGYFAHPGLSAESPHGASGNYGTLDQIAALEWVRRNIAAFGGDPTRVTIFGESAGALSVVQLMASPLAAGLFGAAIAQSVYMPAMPELATACLGLAPAETVGAEFGDRHGAPTLADLRAMPAEALLAISTETYAAIGGTTAVVDGWVQHAQIYETFDQGLQARVPLIAGFTSGEQRGLDPGLLPPFPQDAADFERKMCQAYGEHAGEFLRLYPAQAVVDSSYAAVRDAYYGWAVERLLQAHHRLTPSTWMYLFDHVYRSAEQRGLGAFHASDVQFTFGNVGAGSPTLRNWPAPPDAPADVEMAEVMMNHWTALARSGRPEGEGLAAWPVFDLERQCCLVLRDGSATSLERLMPGMFEFQDAYMRRLQDAGIPWTWANMGTAASSLAPPAIRC